jgi:DNA-directed RNA polymerase specialized sigma24 family protein
MYYRAVARAVGVPEFWVDDAAQDIALGAWRDGKERDALAIRRNAIDAARRYGPRSRRGVRPEIVSLDASIEPPSTTGSIDQAEMRQAVEAALPGLTAQERRALRRRIADLPMTNAASARASAARRKLRRQIFGS